MITTYASRRHSERGAALVAVFWLIALLGMILFSGAQLLEADTKVTRVNRERIFAQRYAESGLAVGQHPAVANGDPLLHFSGEDGGGYDVTVRGEEGRMNINSVLLSADRSAVTRLFVSWGMPWSEASALCDALKDWVDADDLVTLNGAERNEYEKDGLDGMPFNRPFRDLDEMLLVRGMERLSLVKPDWRDSFTVFGDGRMDLNEASAEMIAAIAGLPVQQVSAIEDFRLGPDHIRGTVDDRRFANLTQFTQALGITSKDVVARLGQWVRFDGQVRRIESTGRMASMQRKFVAIVDGAKILWRGEVPVR